jgi:DNA-directed RNA polymerase specialized sigma24 family protein
MMATRSEEPDFERLLRHLAELRARAQQSEPSASSSIARDAGETGPDDEDAYKALHRRICGVIRARAGRIDTHDVEDIAQEVMTKLVQSPPRWQSLGEFYSYVRVVAVHCLADHWKRRRREPPPPANPDNPGEGEPRVDATLLTVTEIREAVCLVLADVRYPHRNIVFLEQKLFKRTAADFWGGQRLGQALTELMERCAWLCGEIAMLQGIWHSWASAFQPMQLAMQRPASATDYRGAIGVPAGETTYAQYCNATMTRCVPEWTKFVLERLLHAVDEASA